MDNDELTYYKRHIWIYLLTIAIGVLIALTGINAQKYDPELGILFPIIVGTVFGVLGLTGLLFLLIDYNKKD